MGRRPATAVLLDTHVWAWSLSDEPLVSDRARAAIEGATQVLVSPISFFEIGQKVRLGKWPEMVPFIDRLADLLVQQGAAAAVLDSGVCLAAAALPWPHRDPFDRLIAATALRLNATLVSADTAFDGIVARAW